MQWPGQTVEKLGVNSEQTFIEATSNITFQQQAEIWLKSLASRKRNPLEQTTIDKRRYALDKWMYPFLGERILADVNNRAMKDFVEHISKLSPATDVRAIVHDLLKNGSRPVN